MHYDLPVARILQRELLVCSPDTSLAVAASRMHEARCGSILVVDEGLFPSGFSASGPKRTPCPSTSTIPTPWSGRWPR